MHSVKFSFELLFECQSIRFLLNVPLLLLNAIMHLVESFELFDSLLSCVVEILVALHLLYSLVRSASDTRRVNFVLLSDTISQVLDEACFIAPEHVELARPVLLCLKFLNCVLVAQELSFVGRSLQVVGSHLCLHSCVPGSV